VVNRRLGLAIALACSASVARAEPDPMPAEDKPVDKPAPKADDTAAKPDKAAPSDPYTDGKSTTKSKSKTAKPVDPYSDAKSTKSNASTKSSKSTKTAKKKTSTKTAKSRKATTPAKRGSHHHDDAHITTSTTTSEEPTDPSRFDKIADPSQTPAVRYGELEADACYAELAHRHIAYTRETATGVDAGVRLAGPLHGVTFRTNESQKQRATSHWEIGDCRLILSLDDFAEILTRYNIVEVRHYSMYRKPSEGEKATPGKRHNGAVAIDAAKFIDKDGAVLEVDKDFHGAIGDKTCGDGAAPHPVTPEATKLRSILCDAVAAHLFNVVLTPNYNPPHHNHFHLEVTRGVKWFLVH
jgi:Extensin-like protein C-terminus